MPTRKLSRLSRPLRNHRGVALLMALFATTIMIFVAVEVSYDTSVEYLVASQQINKLKAYYAAKSGVEISLLRILIYKKAMNQFGSQLKGQEAMLDPVWQLPFAWPPVFPDDLSEVDKDLIMSAVDESVIDGQFLATIESEGGKIDINDLGSEIESLRESTRKQILLIFESERENNQDFRERNYGTDFNEVINNIKDWVDADTENSNGGGPERAAYPEVQNAEFIPPNTPFKTIEELNMVAGIDEELYQLLLPRVTVFGVKGINVNYAPKETLMGLAPTMTEEAVAEVMKRRSDPNEGGPFVDEKDFLGFLQSQRVDTGPIEEAGIPFYFNAVYNFRIRSTGSYQNVSREIEAIVYDFENIKERYIEIVNKEEEEETGGSGSDEQEEQQEQDQAGQETDQNPTQGNDNPNGDNQNSQQKVPKGRPTVVYWKET